MTVSPCAPIPSICTAGGKGASGTLYLTIEKGAWYGIPYRCLLPRNIDNLLVAGRAVSATSVAAAAIRVMPPAMAMGQAAGTAAVLALQNAVNPSAVDIKKLRKTLADDGVFLG